MEFMRSNKAISLIMALLIMSASFITLCPASQNESPKVHLITDPCKSHDCHRNEPASNCNKEFCDHQTCNDKHLFDEINIQNNRFSILIISVPIIFAKHFFELPVAASISVNQNIPSRFPPSLILTTVLRI
jgi:hypothetical protein